MEQGKGELSFEVSTGLGRINILLTYQCRKYIVETKINRSSLERTTKKAIDQLCDKYLLTERANEGYVVIFAPKTTVGELCAPQEQLAQGKKILIFNIGISETET